MYIFRVVFKGRVLFSGPGIIGTIGIVSYVNGASLATAVTLMLLGRLPNENVTATSILFILASVTWVLSSLYLIYFIRWSRRAEAIIEQRWGDKIDEIIDRDLKG